MSDNIDEIARETAQTIISIPSDDLMSLKAHVAGAILKGVAAQENRIIDAEFAATEARNIAKDAIQGLLDWIEEGCPDGGRHSVEEAKDALQKLQH